MIFNFSLVSVEQVQPWGEANDKSLSWFGLTDGQYWIEVGNKKLFEYSDSFLQKQGGTRYCDYQIARLYEDILTITPYALETIPDFLVPYISGRTGSDWAIKYRSWREKKHPSLSEDEFWRIAELAYSWVGERVLDSLYLMQGPRILIWSNSEGINIEWNNKDKSFEGNPLWTASEGCFRISKENFINEVRSFHNSLMQQMNARVKSVLKGAVSKDIRIDFDNLVREQEIRSMPIEKIFSGQKVGTDWTEVMKSIRYIEENV